MATRARPFWFIKDAGFFVVATTSGMGACQILVFAMEIGDVTNIGISQQKSPLGPSRASFRRPKTKNPAEITRRGFAYN